MTHIFHKTATISVLADIEQSTKGSILTIGCNTVVDSFVKIKFTGGLGSVDIGDFCYINSGCVFYSGNGIKIGNMVSIAANCTLAPVNHQYISKSIPIQKQGFRTSKGGIIIEDDVWIGANTVILDGSIIKRGCVIGACSLVRTTTIPYGIYVGNPLKLISSRVI